MSNNDDTVSTSLNVISSISPTDDDISLTTTSAESETFESWTLITDKQKAKATTKEQQQQQSFKDTTTNDTTNDLCNRVEALRSKTPDVTNFNVNTNLEEESNSEIIDQLAKEADDLSDGISIISESSESIGRMSPHPLLREHLHSTLPTLLKPTNTYEDTVDAIETDDDDDDLGIPKDLKRRKRTASQHALQTAQEMPANKLGALLMQFSNKPAVKQGVSAVFYTGVALALFAFMGQLRYSEYAIVTGKSLEKFEQQINELELQNNLMSSEIDLLNKQVNYLTDIYEKTRDGKINGERKSAKTFKAWSGNGNRIDAVHIQKDDLKRAYKCGMDGKSVEIGGMCVEKKANIDELSSFIDEVGKTVNDVLQDRESYKSFEKVAEAFLKNGNEDEGMPEQSIAPAAPVDVKYQTDNSKEHKKIFKKSHRKTQKKFDDSYEDNDVKESHEHSSHEHESHEERHKRVYSSKERQRDSKERKSYDSGERAKKWGNKDAQWHENLMLQRGELRRQRNKLNENHNWYIERGNSREQARSS